MWAVIGSISLEAFYSSSFLLTCLYTLVGIFRSKLIVVLLSNSPLEMLINSLIFEAQLMRILKTLIAQITISSL